MTGSFPRHVPQARNLDIFWAVTLEGRSQPELARQHGLSQQRVSQIVRAVRTFVALATSEQYDGVPQRAQLQLSCRVQLARLEQRRREMSRAWKESTRPKWSVKRVQGASGERVETVEKSQHGDWRVDRQLGEIDQQIVDTTRVLYEREWFGREEAEELRIADCGLGIRGERADRMRNEGEGMRSSEFGKRNDGVMAAVCGIEDTVLGTEYSVLGTEEATLFSESFQVANAEVSEAPAEPALDVEPAPLVPQSAIRNPQSAIAPESAQPQAVTRRQPQPPTCSLTGKRILPALDEHRPWRRVFLPTQWLRANPTASGTTPQGVLWKLAPTTTQVETLSASGNDSSYLIETGWGETGPVDSEHFEHREMLVGG